ncbi:DUF2207 domain-containing protein [Phytohabitans flavus]|uniref:Predicted membrane protein YciQ-like C-terminal domain-containing protein n=1 Tax=Phytohabitans flavus TaxID=1076124 RepID=A0A6F8XPN9_9ACTN|nr:DUF2207 domain-containing protein [Phytohabitans flavus]BCB75767.1 hypothetical protein Pflav_021770 [Phytohabitans flavus]
MDERALLDLAVSGIAIGCWFLAYGLARLVTRPASPPPQPATPDLGTEPPAVVSLLVNRWTTTEDAAESTLLDLAARRFIELRQPGNEPMQTTVHLPAAAPDESGLRPYERRVLSRVQGLAVGGVVPLTALTFRDQAQAKTWNKRLRAEVVAEARAAGLSRRRFGRGVAAVLVALAALAAAAAGAAAYHYGSWSASEDNPGVAAGIVTFLLLSGIAGLSPASGTPRSAGRWPPAGSAYATGCAGTRSSPTCRRLRSWCGTGTSATARRSARPTSPAPSSTWAWATASWSGRRSAVRGTACGSGIPASGPATAVPRRSSSSAR